MTVLTTLGWNAALADELAALDQPDAIPGRVAVPHRGAHDVLTELGELRCDVAGRLYDEATTPAALPVVGDWVAVIARPDESAGTITAVLSRRTRFSRKTAWQATEEQVLAANIDVVFLVTSLNEDLNLRRLERYLILARESGAQPVLLLTKLDLAGDIEARLDGVREIAFDLPVHAISSRTGEGLETVRSYLAPGVTAALLGSSGVGKSTLVNALLGEELLETREIRDDGRGRHTTTRRELVQLPGGGLLIDTPGMREVQLWIADDGLEEAFEDVTSLFEHCRFSDCSHESEPGCAVKAAIADGTLTRERWESYLGLEAELAHLEQRLDKRAQSEARKRWRSVNKASRAAARAKGRRT